MAASTAALPAFGLEGVVRHPDGRPASGFIVTVVHAGGSATTDESGRFSLPVDVRPPLTFLVFGSSGEVYPPIVVEAAELTGPVDLTLEDAFRDSITVTGGASAQLLAPAGSASTVIGAEEIEQRRPLHLAEAVDALPGVSVSEPGAAGVPSIRGLTGGRTLLLLDDARVTAERRAGASATFVDLFVISSIEVARGPGSVAYGPDALGGVILSRTPEAVPGRKGGRYQLSGSEGGAPVLAVGAEANAPVGDGALLVAAHGRNADDGTDGDGATIGNSSFRDYGALLRFGRTQSNGNMSVGLELDRGRGIERASSDSAEVATSYPIESSDRLTFALDSGARFGFETVAASGFLGRYRVRLERARPGLGAPASVSASDTDAWDAGARIVVARALRSGTLRAGVDASSRFGLGSFAEELRYGGDGTVMSATREETIENASQVDGGAFAIVDSPLGSRASLSGSMRIDGVRIRNEGGYFGDHSELHGAITGGAAVTISLRPDLFLVAQLARGFREPSLSDRYFRGVSGRGFVTGNPELDPETSLQADVSAEWRRGSNRAALFVYGYRIADVVERYRVGDNFFFRNGGEATLRGIELELEMPLSKGVTLEISGAIARGWLRSDGSALDGIEAPNVRVGARRATGRYWFVAGVNVFGGDSRPGPTEVARPGVTILDAGAGIHLASRLELRVAGQNLTDRSYAASPDERSALAPGRTLTLSIGGDWLD